MRPATSSKGEFITITGRFYSPSLNHADDEVETTRIRFAGTFRCEREGA